MITGYVLHPFTLMFGFAWYHDEARLEIFLGLFAVSICKEADDFD